MKLKWRERIKELEYSNERLREDVSLLKTYLKVTREGAKLVIRKVVPRG